MVRLHPFTFLPGEDVHAAGRDLPAGAFLSFGGRILIGPDPSDEPYPAARLDLGKVRHPAPFPYVDIEPGALDDGFSVPVGAVFCHDGEAAFLRLSDC